MIFPRQTLVKNGGNVTQCLRVTSAHKLVLFLLGMEGSKLRVFFYEIVF